ncbi:cell adhesion molecule 1-like isoform X1 [Pomacea canaliculata]|uniref:cell adhesion molecule 1-like isoform X1 n=1 Tax=Pomacea canaliculata TaxID=400727 RepID=UPI000D72E433|nr:cell adhesion molecule 1-like isoform X1 [Pomacea canaliculata]
MMIKQSLTFALLLMFIGHHDVRTASVNIESSVGVLGNYPHYMKCSYSLAPGETLLNLDMYQIVNGVQTALGTLYDSGNPVWDGNTPSDIRRRSLLIRFDPTTLQLFYNDTVCSDEKNYTCSVAFRSAEGTRTRSSSTQVTIEASPGAPTMTAVPGYNITENTTVTFTCTGNVGKPPGQFQWYMYRGSTRENQTDQAATQSNTLATPSCTYTGRSSINITMTRMEQGIVMRCRVYHPTQGSNTNTDDCTNPNTGFCRNGERMLVFYPVSISLSPQTPAITVDQGSDYSLTCNAEGYPQPVLRWYKNSDPNYTLGTNSTLKLQNLTLSDSGVYVCIGSNNINGAQLNDSKQVEITIGKLYSSCSIFFLFGHFLINLDFWNHPLGQIKCSHTLSCNLYKSDIS